MAVLFLFLATVIGGYAYLTDSHRVQSMAENYLSSLLGGRVEVGKATLSIFQGLRLDDVHVYAKSSPKEDEEHALFSADSFLIEYNPATLLSGKLAATQIKVVDPHVHLTEDLRTGKWSFQQLSPKGPHTDTPHPGDRPLVLPEILLRNGIVEYSQVSADGEGPSHSITLEGQFIPTLEPDTYHFLLQSRGVIEGVGPSVEGTLVMGTKQVHAKLSNFVVGPDVKAMLPAVVRTWVEDHQVAGAVDAEVNYQLSDAAQRFRVQMELGGVTATVRPEEWMSNDEVRRLDLTKRALGVLELAGLNTPSPGLTSDPFVDHLNTMLSPSPLRLDGVAGQFLFTQDSIDIIAGRGRVESNGFRVEGHIGGYSASAPVHLHVTSPTTENLYVPPAPRYVSSMPGPVRDIYNRFKPQGICSFWADLDRPSAGSAPQVSGELKILDGQFSYEKFSYPVQHVTGVIAVGSNERGEPSMRMEHLKGHGVDGGPNAAADFEINGWMAPLGPEVQIHMDITGNNVSNEPLLTAALPSGAQEAMRMFDADGRGEFPRYRGGFAVQVLRDRGRKSHWTIATDIHLADASGKLSAFPYPLTGVTGDVHIQGEHLEVKNAAMHRGDAALTMNGDVTWGNGSGEAFVNQNSNPPTPNGPSTVKPNLHIHATNVPIDSDLLKALPADRRVWVEKLGVGGVIDVNGDITTPAEEPGENKPLNLDLAVDWRNGTLAPQSGAKGPAPTLLTDCNGKLQLQPEKLTIKEMHGKRKDASLVGHGTVQWATEPPQVFVNAQATNLQLDSTIYALLPPAAKKGWNSVHPEGSVDVALDYSGAVADASATTQAVNDRAGQLSTAAAGYQVTITPWSLAATLDAAPYKLDQLSGSVTIQPDLVEIKDLVGHHGGATVYASGSGIADAWDVHLSGKDMLVDNDLRRATPTRAGQSIAIIADAGKDRFQFFEAHVHAARPTRQHLSACSRVDHTPPSSDVNFAVHLVSADGSMNVGVPLEHIKAVADLSGDTHNGSLHQMTGSVDGESLTLAERSLTDLHVDLIKPADNDLLQIRKLQARIADGLLAGQMEWAYPDKGPSRYAVAMVLQNADVHQLTGEKAADVHGRLSASLNVEGNVNDPGSRQGRGGRRGDGVGHVPHPARAGIIAGHQPRAADHEPVQRSDRAVQHRGDEDHVRADRVAGQRNGHAGQR